MARLNNPNNNNPRLFPKSELVDRILEAQKEAEADKLLVGCDDIYTARGLARKQRDEIKQFKQLQSKFAQECTENDNVLLESLKSDIEKALTGCADDIEHDMVMMRLNKLTYADIAEITGIPESTCRDRIKRIQQSIMNHKYWGLWMDVLEMQDCLSSNWFPMFREQIEWNAMGRPKFPKDKFRVKRAQTKK